MTSTISLYYKHIQRKSKQRKNCPVSRERHFEITNRALVLLWDSVKAFTNAFNIIKTCMVFWASTRLLWRKFGQVIYLSRNIVTETTSTIMTNITSGRRILTRYVLSVINKWNNNVYMMLKAFYSNILWLANIYTHLFLFYGYIGWNIR